MPTLDSERVLAARCRALASRVFRANVRRVRCSWGVSSDQLPEAELVALCEGAALLAFLELGGDVDDQDDFPWADREQELVRAAGRHVYRDVFSGAYGTKRDMRDTPYNDLVRDQGRAAEHVATVVRSGQMGDPELTALERAEALDALLPTVRAILRPHEWRMVHAHYVEGRTVSQIAEGLMCADPARYPAGALNTARSYVSVTLGRARQRLARTLDPSWREALAESLEAA